jgi:hypothetical protein
MADNRPLQRSWSSLTPGTTPLNATTLGGQGRDWTTTFLSRNGLNDDMAAVERSRFLIGSRSRAWRGACRGFLYDL